MKKSVYMLTVLLTGGELHVSIRTIPEVLNCAQAQFYTGSLVLGLEVLAARPFLPGSGTRVSRRATWAIASLPTSASPRTLGRIGTSLAQ